MHLYSVLLYFLVSILPSFAGIYGIDDRKDFYDIPDNKIREMALSTAHIVAKKNLTILPDGRVSYKKSPLGNNLNFCLDEAFIKQTTLGHCSASLVGDDTLLTAGHCFSPYADHKESYTQMYVVFDFLINDPSQEEIILDKNSVFEMKELLYYEFPPMQRESKNGWKDLALVKLDRKVNRPSLKMNKSKKFTLGTKLFMLGHPLGLPLKYTDNGEILSVEKSRHSFRHNLDAFSSNSGSAIFNAETDEIIGVMVRGESPNLTQFSNGCYEWGKAKPGQSEEATFLSDL